MSVEHTFSKPVKFEGQEITSLKMDLEKLTGKDISKIKSRWAMDGKFSPVPGADMDFCAMVACEVSGQPFELMEHLPAKEYMAVCQKVTNFLMGSD